jgi:hypothetical protein
LKILRTPMLFLDVS